MLVAVDIGTTSVKIGLFNEKGRPLGISVGEYDLSCLSNSRVELDPGIYWDRFKSGLKKCIRDSGVSPSSVKAIGVSSQAQTFVCLDKNNKPLFPAIVWLDNRADNEAAGINSDLGGGGYYKTTGFAECSPMNTSAKLIWVRKHLPEKLKMAEKVLFANSYIIHRLTGRAVIDENLAAMSGLYDMTGKEWWNDLLNYGRIPKDILPKVIQSGTAAGYVLPRVCRELGLTPATVVVAGANDQTATAIGAGCYAPGIVCETTGTALVIYTVAKKGSKRPLCKPLSGPYPGSDMTYCIVLANAAGVVFKWCRDNFYPGESYDSVFKKIDRIAPGSEGVIAGSHFTGISYPRSDSNFRGSFSGLGLNHTKAHLARAIVESICFESKRLVEILCGNSENMTIRALGGAAKNHSWLKMKADVLGAVIEKPACTEAGLLGTAIMAGHGCGIYPSILKASRELYRAERYFEPDRKKHGVYNGIYNKYKELCEL